MFNDELILFIDGEYKKFKDASLSVFTHTLHYGSGVFDGLRAHKTTKGTAIFRLHDHINRFVHSTEKIGLCLNIGKDTIAYAIKEVVRRNTFSTAYIRPIAFFDDSSLGLSTAKNKVRFAIGAWQWGKYLPEEMHVKISEFRRLSEKSTFVESKFSGHYVNSLLANNKARQDGFNEALMLDGDECIAEGSVANIFFVKNKKLITPQKGKIFLGITRDSVIQIAKEMGFEVEERNILEKEIETFEESFFTGTAAQVAPITSITTSDGLKTSFKTIVSKKIGTTFNEVVTDKHPKFAHWLEYL